MEKLNKLKTNNMEKVPTLKRIKQWIASIGFRLFIWGNETTEEDYWREIYEQECRHYMNQSVNIDDL